MIKMTEEHSGWASVAALANTGFGFMLFLNGFMYTGLITTSESIALLVTNLMWIVGFGYLIAGIIELRRGADNTGFVILAYSLFGFIVGTLYLITYGLRIFPPPTPTSLLVFWIFWIFVSVISGVILRPLGKMISINLYWLAITFLLFAIAGYGSVIVSLVAGIFAFAQGFYNWYLVAAIVVNTTYKKLLLPLK
jgi:succinate-acetate transporter protein